MTSKCKHCGAQLVRRNPRRDWDATCPACGQLAWVALGDTVLCEVTRVMPFGVLVTFGDGVEGKIHISELTSQTISRPADVVRVGSVYRPKFCLWIP